MGTSKAKTSKNTKAANTKKNNADNGKNTIATMRIEDLGFNVLSKQEVEAARSNAIDYIFA